MTKKNMYKKSDRTFVNPYNFVSIDRKKIKQENIEETYKDKEELHTGYLDLYWLQIRISASLLHMPDLFLHNSQYNFLFYFDIRRLLTIQKDNI